MNLYRRLRQFAPIAIISLAATVAFAHAHLKFATPAPDSVGPAPAQISILFTEGLEPKLSSIAVSTESGAPVGKATAVLDPTDDKHFTLALPPLSPAVYSVHWIAVATDGHRSEGTYKFTVK